MLVLIIIVGILTVLYGRKIMTQTSELRDAVAALGVDMSEALDRVEAKIAELGDPDPDLAADIAAIRSVSTQLDSLAAEAPAAEAPAPTPAPAPEAPPAV